MRINQIDTRQGSANSSSFSNGNCLPYTGTPWGMNYFALSTASSRGAWWFHPEDHTFEGFRLTHQQSMDGRFFTFYNDPIFWISRRPFNLAHRLIFSPLRNTNVTS